MPERPRRLPWLLPGLLALLGLSLAAPAGLLLLADRDRDRAEATPDPLLRLELRRSARERLRIVAALPGWRGFVPDRRRALDTRDEGDLMAQSETLSAGTLGRDAHLAWLDARISEGEPDALALALRQLAALHRYGEEARLEALASRLTGPQAEDWLSRSRLWSGRLPDLPPERLLAAPGLLLHRRGPPLSTTAASPLVALVQAEQARRAGHPSLARPALYALLEAADPVLAGAAAWSLGQGLLDERRAGVAGLSLVGSGADRDEVAFARLQEALLRSPQDEPAFSAAWFVLAELHAEAGRPEAAQEAIWAGLEQALPFINAPIGELGRPPRLDDRAAMHPDRVGPARRLMGEARAAALAAGQPSEALALAEASLLVLQVRGLLALGESALAEARLRRADELVPASPAITAWRVRAALAEFDARAAGAALASLRELPHTEEDEALREATQALLSRQPSARVEAPARAMRALLREDAPADALQALWLAHPDRTEELRLALTSPPDDGADPAQALHQVLRLRALDSSARPIDDEPAARLDRLRALAQAEPLWALFELGAFRLPPPEPAVPPSRGGSKAPLSPPASPDTTVP